MKITEKKLRSVVQSVISEAGLDLPRGDTFEVTLTCRGGKWSATAGRPGQWALVRSLALPSATEALAALIEDTHTDLSDAMSYPEDVHPDFDVNGLKSLAAVLGADV